MLRNLSFLSYLTLVISSFLILYFSFSIRFDTQKLHIMSPDINITENLATTLNSRGFDMQATILDGVSKEVIDFLELETSDIVKDYYITSQNPFDMWDIFDLKKILDTNQVVYEKDFAFMYELALIKFRLFIFGIILFFVSMGLFIFDYLRK